MGIFDDVKRFTQEARGWMASGAPLVAPEKQVERLLICRSCDRFLPGTGKCLECHCFMRVKTWLATVACPIGKWPAEYKPAWFFGDPIKASALLEELVSWKETPYIPGCLRAEQGVAADHYLWLQAVLNHIGSPVEWGPTVGESSNLARIFTPGSPAVPPLIGDILVDKQGRIAIFTGGHLAWRITCLNMVQPWPVNDPEFMGQLEAIYRVLP